MGVLPRLGDYNGSIRCTAADAMAGIAERGDPMATEKLVSLVTNDTDDDVRWTALRALGRVAAHGDDATLGIVKRCINDDDEQVRIAAIEVAGAVAERGDESIIPLLKAQCAGGGDVE